MALREIIEEEGGDLSTARIGIWSTVFLAFFTIGCDIWLTLASTLLVRIPNTVYALETTMFMVFAAWAGGKGMATAIGPQIGATAAGIAAATRDAITKRRKEGEDFDAEAT